MLKVLTYQTWLQKAVAKLTEKNAQEAKVDAYFLLSFVTGKNRASLLAFAETPLSNAQETQLNQLLMRRLQGEPMAYILGEREFWSLNLAVSPATLIPRPDTEVLVETALEKSQDFAKKELRILDLGTGTGAIALALASELPKAQVFGVDFQAKAVELAQENAKRNQLTQVKFWQSDWFSDVSGEFELIVSNPPYIDGEDCHLSQGDVRFEPLTALVAQENGYADLRHIIQQAPQYLTAQGWLLLEHGFEQGQGVREIFRQQGWQNIQTIRDYGANERVTCGQMTANLKKGNNNAK